MSSVCAGVMTAVFAVVWTIVCRSNELVFQGWSADFFNKPRYPLSKNNGFFIIFSVVHKYGQSKKYSVWVGMPVRA
jgi:hypothetical protein